VRDGTTVLLTTRYLDEADHLADDIAVIDHGQVISRGTPDQLKSMIGDRLDVVPADPARLTESATLLAWMLGAVPAVDGDRITVPLVGARVGLADVVRELDLAGVAIADVGVRRASLDEVFLRLTDRSPAQAVRESEVVR
jgi:ABC-2 type transport system ATP-binding protein